MATMSALAYNQHRNVNQTYHQNSLYYSPLERGVRAWTNDKFLATKHHQTLFGDQTFYRLGTLFGAV